jgi:hypothetical protein
MRSLTNSVEIQLRGGSAALNDPAQRLDFLTSSVAKVFPKIGGNLNAAAGGVAHALAGVMHSLACFVSPVAELFASVFIAALNVAAQLLASLWREQQTEQRSRTQTDQQERNRGSDIVTFRRFILSDVHK